MLSKIAAAIAIVAGLWLGQRASAISVTLGVVGGGFTGPETRTCATIDCETPIWSLDAGEIAAVTGIVAVGNSEFLSFGLFGPDQWQLDADRTPPEDQVILDEGAERLTILGSIFYGSNPAQRITELPGGVLQINPELGGGDLTVPIIPEFVGPGGPVVEHEAGISGGCVVSGEAGGSPAECRFTIGPIRIPGRPEFGGYDRFVQFGFDLDLVVLVPEPATLTLLGLGLALLGGLRRAARNSRRPERARSGRLLLG